MAKSMEGGNMNQTKKSIQSSFMKLYNMYDYDKISVKDLCANTPVARTTFYSYYNNIDGITFEGEHDDQEDAADKYAEDKLIPPDAYKSFLEKQQYGEQEIRLFAQYIGRDPGIVLGRLQKDKKVAFTNVALCKALRHKYKVVTA